MNRLDEGCVDSIINQLSTNLDASRCTGRIRSIYLVDCAHDTCGGRILQLRIGVAESRPIADTVRSPEGTVRVRAEWRQG